MAGKSASANPLVVTGKAPDTSLTVQLHPLVLLTISDYITRHTMRKQSGPILGGVIGQQDGRSYTLEHAFEAKPAETTGDVLLDATWFGERLEMYKEVHKVPALDLVALFTIGPVEGPQPGHIPILQQVQGITGSDSILLLLFHPQLVDNLQGGKLPISLYESFEEVEDSETQLRFRELQFDVETSDAEMIGVDFVAKGGGTATAVAKPEVAAGPSSSQGSSSPADKKKGKGKGKAKENDGEDSHTTTTTSSILPLEDDELLSSLNVKVNAIKMLNDRINLIRTYLTSLQPSYLTSTTSQDLPPPETNFQLLRKISALLSRVPLLKPPPSTSSSDSDPPHNSSAQQATQSVHLTSLLATLTRSLSEAHALGTKFSHLQRERQSRDRGGRGGGGIGGAFGMMDGMGIGGILSHDADS